MIFPWKIMFLLITDYIASSRRRFIINKPIDYFLYTNNPALLRTSIRPPLFDYTANGMNIISDDIPHFHINVESK